MGLMRKAKIAAFAAGGIWAWSAVAGPALAHHGVTAAISAPAGSNEALANQMAASGYGWTGRQAVCLDSLWNRESGFSQYADTRKTGAGGDGPGSAVFAYGIAQARPATKYPKAGQPADLGGSSDPKAQVAWGLADISAVYGTPCAAWAHETAQGWY